MAFPLAEDRKILLISGGAGYPADFGYLQKKSDRTKQRCIGLHGGATGSESFPAMKCGLKTAPSGAKRACDDLENTIQRARE